jgi:hypothetical protein
MSRSKFMAAAVRIEVGMRIERAKILVTMCPNGMTWNR